MISFSDIGAVKKGGEVLLPLVFWQLWELSCRTEQASIPEELDPNLTSVENAKRTNFRPLDRPIAEMVARYSETLCTGS